MNRKRYLDLIARFRLKHVLVLGDMVADEYVIGTPTRLSREAPIVVLEYIDRYLLPGGAANLAHNARTLTADVSVCGVIGDDPAGAALRRKLEDLGIDAGGLIVDPDRPTTTKTRIWAGHAPQQVRQQVARVDRVDRRPLSPVVREQVRNYLIRRIPEVDCFLISDYENGMVDQEIINGTLPLARGLGKLITVDSHGDLFRFRGATVVTPNQPEAEATLNLSITDAASLEAAGRRLLEGLESEAVLLTRGSQGMTLFVRGGATHTIPVLNPSLVVDPTGAGDTVAAAFTLALAGGATMIEAAQLSNLAAALVVCRLGAATTTPGELTASLDLVAVD
ncbi:MAG: bifunctional hydroxymethylpyrimidine kinase/phosphomethylpyrimidine kinase [Acidobacteria bacterium]|nr:bifunctional hydroxymethylpyrimidine kinase/phosphomethylpyrimidine kinase [Acidobacteriota bacterium]MBI3658042.1 bifunctional hydroxymethylpyrimidine kinase/phosphomethylpyrimidine kinase [Acidobacteriota bacterium]